MSDGSDGCLFHEGNLAEIFVLIDGKPVVAQNGNESADMSIQEQGAPTPAASSLQSFIIVTIGRRYLAFEAGCIKGVLTVEELDCGEDPAIQRAVDRTVDLIMQLNLADVPACPNTPVVLLADQGIQCSIRVSQIPGRLEIQPSQILPLPAQFNGVERHWYRGVILFEKSIALILNPIWVLRGHAGSNAGHEQGASRSFTDVLDSAAREGRVC